MYVDSKPTTTFRDTSAWTMPSPRPAGSVKRPPVLRTGSSSSSLSGMEKVVPTFQSFVKQTPPVQQNHLPPAPSILRRASSSSLPRPRTPSVHSARRSSSVYSRSVSQFGSENSSWRSSDFADEPLPPLPTLLPVAYSSSTPHLTGKPPTPPLLPARTYISPLIVTPSPTASRGSTPSPPPYHKPSVLLPSPPVSVQVPLKQLRTVPLEQAKAQHHAPGAVHLLPEELRAQTLGKSKSHDAIRVDSIAIISGRPLPQPPEPSTLVDNQGRRRTLRSPIEQYPSEYPFLTANSDAPGCVSPTRRAASKHDQDEMQVALQEQRKASRGKATQALGLDDTDEQRGRTRQRRPRNTDYSNYLPNKRTSGDQSSSDQETDARKIAKDYHALLNDQYRSKTSSPGHYHAGDSDESIKNHMKMVPRPLFQTKPPAKLPGSVTGLRKDSYVFPYRLSDGSENFGNDKLDSSDSSRGPNPFERSLTPESTHKRRSTSGSIPSSPPTDMPSPSTRSQVRGRPIVRQEKTNKRRHGSYDNRASTYCPYIAPRKGRKPKTLLGRAPTQSPPVPLLSTDIVAQRLKTPNDSPISSHQSQHSSVGRENEFRKSSNAISDGRRPSLRDRIAKGAAKYADLFTKPSELPGQRNYPAMVPATGAPVSPHLLRSPVKSQPPRVHLGWSDTAKTSYDTSRALPASPRSPRTPQFTHIAAPARPLDETALGLRETESPRRKGSIFGSVFEGWKENKAEKRREELKKIIKVVPNEPGAVAAGKRRASTFGWM